MTTAAPKWDTLIVDLRRPFTPAAVKFKPLTKPGSDQKSSAAFYIDARLVAERLNEVVGPGNWSDEYMLIADGGQTPELYYPVVCRLTILGVTKSDVGQGANTVVDEKAWKSAYSDALKRAAVKFGVGAYLYAIPRMRASIDVDERGKARGFTKEGAALLKASYERWLSSPLNAFGEPFDHGDVGDDEPEPQISAERKTPPAKPAVPPAGSPTPAGAAEGADGKSSPAAAPAPVSTDAEREALFALVEEKGGDAAVCRAAEETARTDGKTDYAAWFKFQMGYWEAQKKPFVAPKPREQEAA